MAIFHYSIKIISRGKGGKSAVAAAAYRAGEKIKNERDGVIHDYTRKGGVVHTEIFLPENAPPELADRAVLWNTIEKVEKASNSQLAREIEFSLPIELTREQNVNLAREYVKRHFVDKGMCADICIHDKKDGNPHAHVMLTMRPFNDDGTWGDKQKKEYILDKNGEKIYDKKKKTYKCKSIATTDWNEQTKAEEWRAAWESSANTALERNGSDSRIDHRSFVRQGKDELPTVHMGVAAMQMEEREIRTVRGDMNRAIEVSNRELRQLRARIQKVKDWLFSAPITNAPTLIEMMNNTSGGEKLKSQWKKIADLKTQAKALIFLQENGIGNVVQLADKVTHMHERQYDVANRIKAIDRRKTTLTEHLSQVDIYKQHTAVYKKHKGLDPKKRGKYGEKHADEIKQYESASAYLKAHLNGYAKIPEKDWQAEFDQLTAERYALCEDYYKLKDDVKNVEVLRRGAESIMRDGVVAFQTPTHKQDIVL